MIRAFICSFLIILNCVQAQSSELILEGDKKVYDTANLIADENEPRLVDLIKSYQQDTGNQIAVVTVDSLNGAYGPKYAKRLAGYMPSYGDKDNWVIILGVKEESQVYIVVGKGLADILLIRKAGEIANWMSPGWNRDHFRLINGTEWVIGVLNAKQPPNKMDRLIDTIQYYTGDAIDILAILEVLILLPITYLVIIIGKLLFLDRAPHEEDCDAEHPLKMFIPFYIVIILLYFMIIS